jgi:hypothetical protein
MRQLKTRYPCGPTASTATGDDAQRKRRLRLPTSSAALAVSIVALVVAMAGSAYAGVTLGKGSVGTKQLQKGAVTNGKIAKGAISAGKLKAGLTVPNAAHANTADSATNATNATNAINATNAAKAITATSASTAANAANATNAINATNAATAANATALAKVTYIQSQPIASAAGGGLATNPSDTAGSVTCPTGTSAIGGGFFTSNADMEISESVPTFGGGATKPATGWNGFVDNFDTTAHTFSVWAICTPVTAGASTLVPVGPVPTPPGR